ncbi:hypothetical protein [Polaromonas sp.]|jgi:hypothetical protein|uniref:tetratricopeptide repeat protein n=1 Tax=Polaromonas sp. TaxID=1869339 RepID=UPI001D3FC867|nr:hypothetical protein [Polaromonas sp.]MBT9475063.1 hypothetical protein [Polaromonas sp.]
MTWAWLAWPLCALALVLDAGIASLMLAPGPSAPQLMAALLAHAAACLLFSMALIRLLPATFGKPAFASGLFVFMTIIFIPVLGMVGLLVSIVPLLRRRGPVARPVEWQHPQLPDLPSQPDAPRASGGLLGSGDLAGTLQHAKDPRKRTEALIATLALEDVHAVPLLRLALKDPDDEVRLLAFSLLNRKEKAIEARMRARQARAGECEPDQVFLKHKALAHDFWELAQLGASQGSTQTALCGRALEQVQAALQLRPHDGGLHFLRGQIHLKARQLDAASDALEAACRCGVDMRQAAPLLAEIAFRKRRYADVKHHLKRAGRRKAAPTLRSASTYWDGV